MSQRHPWTELPRLNQRLHDAEIQGIAIRRRLIRVELKPEAGRGTDPIQLQFLGVKAVRSGSLWTQNVVYELQLATVADLPADERDELLWDGAVASDPVYTLDPGVGIWLQVACESAGFREWP